MKMMILAFTLAGCGAGTKDDPNTTCDETNEACDPGSCSGDGGQMLPGADCLACHDGSTGPKWTAAGTVFADADGTSPVEGAIVRITDADGNTIELTSNAAGNYYTNKAITMPLSAEIELDGNVLAMSTTPSTGACNTCHTCAGQAGGKLYAE